VSIRGIAAMRDLLVVGAGPAGSALAIHAGRAGLTVDLFDAARFPREKPCGEGIMPAGVRALERLGVLRDVGGAAYSGIRYRGFGIDVTSRFPVSVADGARPSPFGLGQRRLVLDAVLLDRARATPGVRVFEGSPVDGLVARHGRVVGLEVCGRQVTGRLIVGADGARSRVRHHLGLDAARAAHPRIGWRLHYRLSATQAPPTEVEIYVGVGHELYLTPLPNGCVLLAALTEGGEHASATRATLATWVRGHPALAERLRGATPVSTPRGRSPLVHHALAGVAPGAVLLGDAAGNSDPITGGGISQALLSAELLAEALPTALRGNDGGDREYDGDWLWRFDRRRRAMLRDYRLLTGMMVRLARRPALARGTLTAMRASPRLMGHLVGVAAGLRPFCGLSP
jgi:flavin-dependent dehydrogenase